MFKVGDLVTWSPQTVFGGLRIFAAKDVLSQFLCVMSSNKLYVMEIVERKQTMYWVWVPQLGGYTCMGFNIVRLFNER